MPLCKCICHTTCEISMLLFFILTKVPNLFVDIDRINNGMQNYKTVTKNKVNLSTYMKKIMVQLQNYKTHQQLQQWAIFLILTMKLQNSSSETIEIKEEAYHWILINQFLTLPGCATNRRSNRLVNSDSHFILLRPPTGARINPRTANGSNNLKERELPITSRA